MAKPTTTPESALATAFAQAEARPTTAPSHKLCGVCRLLRDLPESDAAALRTTLESSTLSAPAIADVLRSQGHGVNNQAIGHHRRGSCTTSHIYGGVQR